MKSPITLSIMLLSMSLVATPLFAKSDTNKFTCCPKIKHEHKCKSVINITAHDINEASKHSAEGLVLRHPGNYKVCENVRWKTKRSESYAITIKADNVSLDLDGHFIKQHDTTLANNYAIQVTGDTQYTLIHNGTLQQISGGGVIVQGGARGITIDQIECNRCCYAGQLNNDIFPIPFLSAITLFGTSTAPIQNAVITNCNVTDNGIIGIEPVWFQATIAGTTLTLTEPPLYPLTPGFELRLSDGTTSVGMVIANIVEQLSPTTFTITPTAPIGVPTTMTVTDPNGAFVPALPIVSPFGPTFTGYTFAISTLGTSNVSVEHNIVNKSFGYTASYALTFVGSRGLVVSNNLVHNLTTFGLTKGLFLVFMQDCLVEDLAVDNLVCNAIPLFSDTSIGHGAEGTKVSGVSNTILRRVTYDGSTVQTEIPTTLTHPTAYYDCVGLITDFIGLSDLLIEDCVAKNMINDGGRVASNPSYTAGFNAATFFGNIQNLHYSRCTAFNITASAGYAWGFGCNPGAQALGDPSNLTYSDCVVHNVRTINDGIYAAGFLINGTENQVVRCSANQVVGSSAYGILLGSTNSSQGTRCIIANNRVTHCDTYGIVDATNWNVSHNIFNSNYAYLNGIAGNNNYQINFTVNPVRAWSTTGAPDPVDQFGILDPELDNLDIRSS
ncbi:MAG: hypothetical protein AB7F19_01585 [Candidatus Babeliales bacterium]